MGSRIGIRQDSGHPNHLSHTTRYWLTGQLKKIQMIQIWTWCCILLFCRKYEYSYKVEGVMYVGFVQKFVSKTPQKLQSFNAFRSWPGG